MTRLGFHMWILERSDNNSRWIQPIITVIIKINWMFQVLLQELLKSCDMELKTKVVDLAALHESQMHLGSKTIFHLEAFVANFMSVYLSYIEESVGSFV